MSAPATHACDIEAMWALVNGEVLWLDWYCPTCDARWIYNRFPGSAEGRWWTEADWMSTQATPEPPKQSKARLAEGDPS